MIYRSDFFANTARTSCLGFGTPAFMAVESPAERARMFATLLEGGVTHFDTAAYYGYGAAEKILGELVQGRRHELTITTKFGIQPPKLLKSGAVNRLARGVLRRLPQLRAILSRGAQAATTRGAFSVDDARRSLASSLRALNTSYVDLFLLHEPAPSDALNDDLIAFLQSQVQAGTIRAFGCGGAFHNIAAGGVALTEKHVYLQFEDSVAHPNRGALAANVRTITYGSIGSAPRALGDALRRDATLLRQWNDALGLDVLASSALATLLVRAAIARNPQGLVLFSSTKLAHIKATLQALATDVDAQQLNQFWELARTVGARPSTTQYTEAGA